MSALAYLYTSLAYHRLPLTTRIKKTFFRLVRRLPQGETFRQINIRKTLRTLYVCLFYLFVTFSVMAGFRREY
jgi:hypothetical protein